MFFNLSSNKMTRNIVLRTLLPCLAVITAVSAHAQNDETKTPEEVAFEESERLERLLKLEPHQTFFVDSILQHDMRGMHNELQALQMSGTQEYTAYMQVREKWTARMDSAYKKVLSYDQWLLYRRMCGKLSKEEAKILKAKEKVWKKEKKEARRN